MFVNFKKKYETRTKIRGSQFLPKSHKQSLFSLSERVVTGSNPVRVHRMK